MRLLVFVEAADQESPTLSFFHRWLTELAGRVEELLVLCLQEGSHTLPSNVQVYSLGKEHATGIRMWKRIRYAYRFYRYIVLHRNEYDAVLVYMNQEYVLLGGLLWRMFGKPVYMWRNHYAGSFFTDLAAFFCTKVFYTSRFSYTAKYTKAVQMPVGIDTNVFHPDSMVIQDPATILSFGRISPSKRIELLIEACRILRDESVPYVAHIYGDALPEHLPYLESLKQQVQEYRLEDHVLFYPGVVNTKAPELYQQHALFVNMSGSGMFDKTIFEAMASGTLAVSSSKDLEGKVDKRLLVMDPHPAVVAGALTHLLALSQSERDRLSEEVRHFVEDNHSLAALGKRLVEEITETV